MQAVVNIAASRHMTTTAEGVETQAQLEMLRKLGCTDMQVFPSSIPGGDGNIEFFLGARRG